MAPQQGAGGWQALKQTWPLPADREYGTHLGESDRQGLRQIAIGCCEGASHAGEYSMAVKSERHEKRALVGRTGLRRENDSQQRSRKDLTQRRTERGRAGIAKRVGAVFYSGDSGLRRGWKRRRGRGGGF